MQTSSSQVKSLYLVVDNVDRFGNKLRTGLNSRIVTSGINHRVEIVADAIVAAFDATVEALSPVVQVLAMSFHIFQVVSEIIRARPDSVGFLASS